MEFGRGMKIGAGITCGCCGMVFLIIGGLIALGSHGRDVARAAKEARKQSALPSSEGGAQPTKPETWEYETKVDPMDSSSSKFARLDSTNTLELDFPYQGEQKAKIIIRKRKRDGTNAMFMVQRGQINMGIDGGNLLIRFDEKPPQKFGITESSDHDSKFAFITNGSKFISELKKSKKTLIQVEFFNNGIHTMEFNTEGFQWE